MTKTLQNSSFSEHCGSRGNPYSRAGSRTTTKHRNQLLRFDWTV